MGGAFFLPVRLNTDEASDAQVCLWQRLESFRSQFPILRHHPGSERLSPGETAGKTPGFLRVCTVDSGLRERNERPNLSPKGQFSPRPGAMGVSAPGRSTLN